MVERTKRTLQKRAKFLKVFRERANVTEACEAVGLTRSNAYEMRDEDPEFAAAWKEAEEAAADKLEAEAWRRAHDGYDRPVYQQGGLVGYVREYSDTLLCKLLVAHRPEKFAERNKVAHSIDEGFAERLAKATERKSGKDSDQA